MWKLLNEERHQIGLSSRLQALKSVDSSVGHFLCYLISLRVIKRSQGMWEGKHFSRFLCSLRSGAGQGSSRFSMPRAIGKRPEVAILKKKNIIILNPSIAWGVGEGEVAGNLVVMIIELLLQLLEGVHSACGQTITILTHSNINRLCSGPGPPPGLLWHPDWDPPPGSLSVLSALPESSSWRPTPSSRSGVVNCCRNCPTYIPSMWWAARKLPDNFNHRKYIRVG